jgi:hypothetical protein
MKPSTVFMWAVGCVVGAALLGATAATVDGYPYDYSDGSIAIEKMPSTNLLFSGPVELPFGPNFTPVRSDIGLLVLPGSTGQLGINRLSNDNDLVAVAGFLDVRFGVGVEDIDDTSDYGGGLPNLFAFTHTIRFTLMNYTAMFDSSQPNGGVFPREGAWFIGEPFARDLADLDEDGEVDELQIRDIAFWVGDILDTRREGTSLLHDFIQQVTFSGSIQPDFGPIVLSGVSTFRQEIVFPGNQAVPEPASLVLIGAGLAGLGAIAWRRSSRHSR